MSTELSADEVRQRLRWARRRGNPAWLWPDIAIDEWRRALHAIERVTRAVLADESPVSLAGDAAAIGLAGYTSGTGPLLGWWQRRGLIRAGEEIAATLDLHFRHNSVRAARMGAATRTILSMFEGRGVPVAIDRKSVV